MVVESMRDTTFRLGETVIEHIVKLIVEYKGDNRLIDESTFDVLTKCNFGMIGHREICMLPDLEAPPHCPFKRKW